MTDPSLRSGRGLPSGTVTFLLTDIEGSTALWEQQPEEMRPALARHDALFEAAVARHGGVHIRPRGEGDSRFAVFGGAADAVSAASAIQRAFAAEPWRTPRPVKVRIAIHSGEAQLREGDYYGSAVNRCARIRGLGYGGQVLLSEATAVLVRDTLPSDIRLLDLGAHRLRDLTRPERVFQLVVAELRTDFPPIRSLDTLPNNLPRQLTSFVGREREMAEVIELLGTAVLLTLTGTGGAGKTRLALQVAAELVGAYADGVWLVELAPLSDPDLVPKAVASALGLLEQPRRSLMETLSDFLEPRALLLVLDNCEHLVMACAALADHLLRVCPRLKILATSREPLGIAGETTWRVPSLSVPDPQRLPPLEQIVQYESARLFIDRAAAARPGFSLTDEDATAVAQLCHRLDGIPLAIELAAARVKALTVGQIAARLDDRFRLLTGGSRTALPRQQTLRGAIDWSYDLLAAPERVVLRRLSAFAGGCTLEAAETVCAGDDVDEAEVLDPLSRLVDRSLVLAEDQGGMARYRLLETVRQYAQDRLAEAGEAAVVRDQHRDWFLRLAEEAEAELHGPGQAGWFDRLEQEHDNLRAALAWSQAGPAGLESGLRLAGALPWFWAIHGHMLEGREQLQRLLVLAPAPTAARAKALQAAGFLERQLGDYAAAAAHTSESLASWRERGDRRGVAVALAQLGQIARLQGDCDRAAVVLQESLTLFEELGGESGVPSPVDPVAHSLAEVAAQQGDYQQAQVFYQHSVAQSRQRGDQHGLAGSLRGLASVARFLGDDERSTDLLKQSVALLRELKDRRCASVCLEFLARLSSRRNQAERAACLFGAAESLRRSMGTPLSPSEVAGRDRDVAAVRAEFGEEAFAAAWDRGQAMTLEEAIAHALEASDPT